MYMYVYILNLIHCLYSARTHVIFVRHCIKSVCTLMPKDGLLCVFVCVQCDSSGCVYFKHLCNHQRYSSLTVEVMIYKKYSTSTGEKYFQG